MGFASTEWTPVPPHPGVLLRRREDREKRQGADRCADRAEGAGSPIRSAGFHMRQSGDPMDVSRVLHLAL